MIAEEIDLSPEEDAALDAVWQWIAKNRKRKGLTESCVPNKTGKGHHDDQSGKPCAGSSGAAASRPPNTLAASHDKAAAKASVSDPNSEGEHRPKRSKPKRSERKPRAERSVSGKQRLGSLKSKVGNDNERRLAKALPKHKRLPDSEAMDMLHHAEEDGTEHGFEVKTLLTNKRGTVHMDTDQKARKEAWQRGELQGILDPTPKADPSFKVQRRVHMVVIDHRPAFHDLRHSKAGSSFKDRKLDKMYYSRGLGTKNVRKMVGVNSPEDLHALSLIPDDEYAKIYSEFVGKVWTRPAEVKS